MRASYIARRHAALLLCRELVRPGVHWAKRLSRNFLELALWTPTFIDYHTLLPYASSFAQLVAPVFQDGAVGILRFGDRLQSSLCSARALPIRFSVLDFLRSPDHFLALGFRQFVRYERLAFLADWLV